MNPKRWKNEAHTDQWTRTHPSLARRNSFVLDVQEIVLGGRRSKQDVPGRVDTPHHRLKLLSRREDRLDGRKQYRPWRDAHTLYDSRTTSTLQFRTRTRTCLRVALWYSLATSTKRWPRSTDVSTNWVFACCACPLTSSTPTSSGHPQPKKRSGRFMS